MPSVPSLTGTTERVCLVQGTAEALNAVHSFIAEKVREIPQAMTKPEVVNILQPQTTMNPDRAKQVSWELTAGFCKAGEGPGQRAPSRWGSFGRRLHAVDIRKSALSLARAPRCRSRVDLEELETRAAPSLQPSLRRSPASFPSHPSLSEQPASYFLCSPEVTVETAQLLQTLRSRLFISLLPKTHCRDRDECSA